VFCKELYMFNGIPMYRLMSVNLFYLCCRFSDLGIGKNLKTSWQKKMAIKAERKSVKDFQKQLKEERTQELEVCL